MRKQAFFTFPWRHTKGVLNVRIFQFEKDQEKIATFSNWLGKSLVMDLLILLLNRINSGFTQEKNGWHFQDEVKVTRLKDEMKNLLEKDWKGVEKKEEQLEEMTPSIEA